MKPRIAIFCSSLVSGCDGVATYYRGVTGALAARGYHITSYPPVMSEQHQQRELRGRKWTQTIVDGNERLLAVEQALEAAAGADVVIKMSGAGGCDDLLESALPSVGQASTQHIFWDVEPAVTLDRLAGNAGDPFLSVLPGYDLVLTCGGGAPVVEAYKALGARACVPIYNALDPAVHHQARPDPRFAGDLGFLGDRRPDRETRVEQGFLAAATMLPDRRFVLGGNGWQDRSMPANVSYVGHLHRREHNAFNSTPRAVLNISRASMARYGFSPATRVFAAAGAGACLISDDWRGLSTFLEPGSEVLVAYGGEHVAAYVETLDDRTARRIGRAARARVLAEHTYDNRADTIDALIDSHVRA